MLDSSPGSSSSKKTAAAEEPGKSPSLQPAPPPSNASASSSVPQPVNGNIWSEDDKMCDKGKENKQQPKKRRLPPIAISREHQECSDELVVGEGRAIKKFKIVHNVSAPFIYCEIVPNESSNDASGDNEEIEKVEYTIRPFTGVPFKVSVPKHGCLFDLYDAIFVAIQVPWERQVLSAGGVILPYGEAAMLSAALPCKQEIDLTVRMNSGMEAAPLNPDLALCDFEDDIEDEYDEDDDDLDEVEGEGDRETHEIVVSLENLDEASRQLQSLALDNIAMVRIECGAMDYATDGNHLSTTLGTTYPIQTSATLPSSQQDGTIAKGLSGPATCHFCRIKCRPALQFTCKCGQIFCHLHRYYDQHRCPIDIASIDRAGLSKSNPRIVKDRL